MKRLTVFAATVVGLALGAAACSDSPVQPTQPSAALATELSPSLSIVPNRLDACSLFLPADLCARPRTVVCTALTTGGVFTVTTRLGVATITITPVGRAATVVIAAPGRQPVTIQIRERTIDRLCRGGTGGGGGEDDDRH